MGCLSEQLNVNTLSKIVFIGAGVWCCFSELSIFITLQLCGLTSN